MRGRANCCPLFLYKFIAAMAAHRVIKLKTFRTASIAIKRTNEAITIPSSKLG